MCELLGLFYDLAEAGFHKQEIELTKLSNKHMNSTKQNINATYTT